MIDKFITNYSDVTFLEKVNESLDKCSSFSLSVSFIKNAGLVLIESSLEAALKRGAKGKIITSTYQNFTDVSSLEKFLELTMKYENFECHLDYSCFGDNGFHSKGYLFDYDGSYEFIVGSTNITRFALLKNIEWNVSCSSDTLTESMKEAYKDFDYLWNKTLPLSEELIKKYQCELDISIEKWDMDYVNPISSVVKPNSMQKKALKELRRYRDMGVSKALVVSATGSGKTYLAAFDARNFDAKRVLFVVHKDKILSDAKGTFEKVFGSAKTYGLFVGNKKDIDADFLFASNQLLYRHLSEFGPKEFDYIVMDECHHAVATTYKSIIEYFKPEFMLGITATPERMDNQDVFEMFDKNVPYELRLRDAIINDLVVPFHYYGIRDKLVDYGYKDNVRVAKEIANTNNVSFIADEIEKHRPTGKLKAIAFCTSVAHAQLMADEFNNVGYSAIALTGANDLGQRIKAFNDIQDENNPLEIICAIDILNEGIDIPRLNMVLFLRPTESSTIFLQQLGRGLRKAEGKDYVTILDFIGNNYDRSIQIAMALGSLGESTIIEKPYLRDLIMTDFQKLEIPGVIINIDELSKEDIIDHLDNCNFNKKDFLIKDYENYKIYLKKDSFPLHIDYLNNDVAPDLLRFLKSKLDGKKNRSYYTFLKKIGESSLPIFDDEQIKVIDSLSEMLPIVRVDEYIIVKQVLDGSFNADNLVGYNSKVNINTIKHALDHLQSLKIIDDSNNLTCSLSDTFRAFINDLVQYGLERYEVEYGEYEGDFKLYSNYFSEQIQTLKLRQNSPCMRGTEFDLKSKITYCYVTIHKEVSGDERLLYKDKFLSSKVFQWESVKDTTATSGDGPKLLLTEKVYLFVRKLKEEDGIAMPFTFFGTGRFTNCRNSSTKQEGKEYSTLMLDIVLDNEVPKKYWFDFDIEEEE